MSEKLLTAELEILLCEFLHPEIGIVGKLDRLCNLLEKSMSQLDDLNAAIDALGTQVGAASQEITTALNDLMAKAGSNPDLAPAIAKIAAINNTIAALGKAALSDDPGSVVPPATATTTDATPTT